MYRRVPVIPVNERFSRSCRFKIRLTPKSAKKEGARARATARATERERARVHVRLCAHVGMCVCTRIFYVGVKRCARMNICAHIYVRVDFCTYVYVLMYSHEYKYTHIYQHFQNSGTPSDKSSHTHTRTDTDTYIHLSKHLLTFVSKDIDTNRNNRKNIDRDMKPHIPHGVATVSRIDKITGLFCRI